VQSFDGAELVNLTPVQAFIEPRVRFDLDRMDDNDNRLFSVTAEIMWYPKAGLPADAQDAALFGAQLSCAAAARSVL
jgi:hypothetical protein